MSIGVPLAWLQLTQEKRRLLAALAGIAFAVVLMLTQLGLEGAFISSAGLLGTHLSGDIVLISTQYQNIVYTKSFTERRLYQALGIDGVESVEPLYVGQAPIMNPFDRKERRIFLIAFKPQSAVLDVPGVAENLEKLRTPGTIIFDSIRRPEFGPVAEVFTEKGPVMTEVAGNHVEIAGLFQLGTSFGADGNLVMSDETFLKILPMRQRGLIDLGLIHLKPGTDAKRAKAAIARIMEPDVRVLTHAEFVDLERNYWIEYTAIGFIFTFGTLMGMFIGCIIVYQILYSDVTDHLPEYATLKAMGYPDSFLFKVVIQEALILSVFGFFPGLAIATLLYKLTKDATFLPMEMTLSRAITVFVLTTLMCTISGLLAMRRLKAADPAEIF